MSGLRVFGLILLAASLACVPARGGWDVRGLEARHPSLARQPGQRLGDATPYFAPDAKGSELVLFLCRWRTEAPLRVSLPAGATRVELDAISLALAAWEGAGLGLRFEYQSDSEPADIELRFAPDHPPEQAPPGVGVTIADCALGSGLEVGSRRDQPLDASLAFASIELQRVLYDPAGRPSPVSPEQLIGVLIHELGHAFGFSGHVISRDSVMTAAPGEVRRLGARVLAGEPLRDPTLKALYSLPSGVVVGRLAIEPGALTRLLRFEALARERGLRGPYVRVGDQAARLLWREPSRRAAGSFVVRDWSAVRRDPSSFVLVPTPRAVSLLRAK